MQWNKYNDQLIHATVAGLLAVALIVLMGYVTNEDLLAMEMMK